MNFLTKTCFHDLPKNVFSYFGSPSFFEEGFLFCLFDFDAFSIIYVHLTNFKE